MSELKGIQEFVQDIAEAISAALDLGVEIIDTSLLRIAGTGESKQKVGTTMAMGHICRHALTCKQPFILKDPGTDCSCEVCSLYKNCNIIKAGLFMPILLEAMPIGLINLVAFNDEQKNRLLKQQGTYIHFVSKMAELLSSKVAEFRGTMKLKATSEFVKTIINSIDLGILGVDVEGYITHINPAAAEILGLSGVELKGSHIKTVLPQSPLCKVIMRQEIKGEQVVAYQTGSKKVRVLSQCYPVVTDGLLTGAIESFYRLIDVQKTAERWSGTEYNSTLAEIIGENELVKEVKAKVLQVAQGKSTVLIEGESGTGKELFARAIHAASPRWNKPLKIINCSAIPDALLESELFGYEEGAFTGAKQGGKAGKFELAEGGTIFLDEIGELPIYLQAKLLRVLQNKTIERIGGNKEIQVDVRVIAATNREMEKMVRDGEFREDLYYRLNVIPLNIPSLRERKSDIPVLVDFFIEKYNKLLEKSIRAIHPETLEILKKYRWPGNIRELENAIEYACNFEQEKLIMPVSLPSRILLYQAENTITENVKLKDQVKDLEKSLIIKVITAYEGNLKEKEKIANTLGISVPSLYRKLKEYDISIDKVS
ncbi:MAG: sigma 54-interacting transcriptional regulator [Bacillota bacterium]|nr:sigma 54-interacting transcriptional regulator [Bacillota bacterium]